MLDPITIESCKNEDFEEFHRCEEAPPEEPDDDDDGPPGGGDPFTPPQPGPGPFGENPCDPGPAPEVFSPLGPTIRIETPDPGVTRIVRLYPQHLSGGAPGTAGAGTGALTGHDTVREFPCPDFQIEGAPACNGTYTVAYHYDGPDLWITWSYPGESSDVAYRVEDYNPQGQLISVWQQDCEWVMPEYPILRLEEEREIIHAADIGGWPGNNSTITSRVLAFWSVLSPVFPPGSTDHAVELEWDDSPLFGSPGASIVIPLGDPQPWSTTAGASSSIGANCSNKRFASTFVGPFYFRGRFVWNNPGLQVGPWSPLASLEVHDIEDEPLWTVNPNYCTL